MAQTLALVLSGGGGERLSVLTHERAVSAVPFGGKYRIIDFVLSNCSHSGIDRVGVVTQHAPTSLHDHIGSGRPWDLDRRTGGVLILQPYQTRSHAGWYRGTADALVQNLDLLDDQRPPRVLVLSGDHVYRMDYRALFETHERRGAALTIAITRVAPDQSWRFGMVERGADDRVVSLVEKPSHSTAPFASMGIYLFEQAALRERLRDRPIDLVLDVVRPMLAAGERVVAHEFEGYWDDVGTVRTFYRANQELVSAKPRFALYDASWPILTRDEERPPVRFEEGASVQDSLIANGCRIAGTVRRSVLFPGVRVEAGADIADAVVMADGVIERDARIDRAIVDKYVRIGEGARIGEGEAPERPELAWLDGLVVIGKDAVVPPGTSVGRSTVIGVGAGPEAFAQPELAAGSLIPNRSWLEGVR